MLNAKQAVHVAFEYIAELYQSSDLQNLILEEIEFSDDSHWLITLSFVRYFHQPKSMLQSITPPKSEHAYKIFEIDPMTKEVLSMKIREI